MEICFGMCSSHYTPGRHLKKNKKNNFYAALSKRNIFYTALTVGHILNKKEVPKHLAQF